jgi:DNA repair exonuclease SbcCD ATPase subunit
LKSQYDKKEKQLKHSIFEKAKTKRQGQRKLLAFKAPCINCKRRVGTIWSKTRQTYLAICGDSAAPCNFHIEIYSGDFFYLEDLLGVYYQEIEQYKQSIIQQKMDTLFNYISEAKSAAIFKKKMDEYIAYSAIYKTLLDQYDELYNNMYKKEQLRKTMEEMYEILSSIQEMLDEYKKDGAYEVLHMAIMTYKDDLLSKMDSIRRLNSEIIEINTEELKPNCSIMLDTLIKREYPLSMMEYSMSEPPKIIKFSKVE